MDFSIVKILTALWQCILTQYPDLAKSVLEVVGGATLAYRGLRYARRLAWPGEDPNAPDAGGLLRILGALALNAPTTPKK